MIKVYVGGLATIMMAAFASVGYESYSHFNRIFRQAYRITPAAYRAFAARELGTGNIGLTSRPYCTCRSRCSLAARRLHFRART
jgi:AraC-like DNA-binding protein